MAKQTTKTVNGNIETFNNYYTRRTVGKTYNVLATDFFAAKYAVNTATGETYTLTPAMKLVYMHMRNAYCVQIEKGNDYFEGWTSICVSSGLSEKAYTKFKATLINLGLVVEGATKGRAKVLVVRDSATLTDIEFTNDDKVKLKAEQAEKRELYKAEQAASTP
ncbi:DUF6945 domain-containing protein, partial [Vibrio sp. M260118]|uniref:DUF6945 domain-containing protein n=1 Tax=Vibrio sp. M260118 TaxID=3020896 RepID=UPI002F417211